VTRSNWTIRSTAFLLLKWLIFISIAPWARAGAKP
jgi:hypothetical protein